MIKILLSVAGYDPTGGAGVLLDLKLFRMHGFHGMGILTSLTAQNTQKVKKVHFLPPDFLEIQFNALSEDISLAGIKIGMIGSPRNLPVIKKILEDNPYIPRVIDPVLISSSGDRLFFLKKPGPFIKTFTGHASLLTPNISEASWLSDTPIKNTNDMFDSAVKIFNLTQTPCLIKGGHLQEKITDILYDGKQHYTYKHKRINKDVHGTGCFLSSVILTYLASGNSLYDAVERAGKLTHEAIKSALSIGSGRDLVDLI